MPSLISLWSTAPFLLNNTVGPFDPDPSVEARMSVFDASIEQMLWPEKRERDACWATRSHGTIDRTDVRSQISIPSRYVPKSCGRCRAAEPLAAGGLRRTSGDPHARADPEGHAGQSARQSAAALPEAKAPSDIVKHYDELFDLLPT